MDEKSLRSLSPLDGRYHEKTQVTREIFSELGLIKHRLKVEVEWLKYFLNNFREDLLTPEVTKQLDQLSSELPDSLALRVKEIEKTTNHDVKAVELALAEQFDGSEDVQSLIHIFLTSEDVNSVSYALMLKDIHGSTLSWFEDIQLKLKDLAEKNKDLAMLSRTHGQPASPTKLGKEILVFSTRIKNQRKNLIRIPNSAKFAGAVGNFNAHKVAFPETNWKDFGKRFVELELGLDYSFPTTQIEHYDSFASLCDNVRRINNILLDLSLDIWTYISLDYFKQKINKDEVGSSAMPHKINPIDFENAEGNIGIANSIFDFFSNKLTKSRLQRDLSDSTVLRNIGVPFSHTVISIKSIIKGLDKLIVNKTKINADLEDNWIIISEAIQTILRREGYSNPYESLKELTRKNSSITKEILHKFIDDLEVSEKIKNELKVITPSNYTGI